MTFDRWNKQKMVSAIDPLFLHVYIYTYICIAWLFGRVQVDNSSSNNDVIWDTVLLVMSWSRTVNWPTVIAPLEDRLSACSFLFALITERTGGFADGSRFRTRLKRLMSKIRRILSFFFGPSRFVCSLLGLCSVTRN